VFVVVVVFVVRISVTEVFVVVVVFVVRISV